MVNNNCTEKDIRIILSYLRGARKIHNDTIKAVVKLLGGKEISEEIAYKYFYNRYTKIIEKQQLKDFDSLLDRANEYCMKYYIGF